MIRVKRVYEPAAAGDGFRILVEGLWPRGVSKARGRIDLWTKEVAPSPALRKWYGHDPEKWDGFRRRYRAELRRNPEVGRLRAVVRERKNVTFVYAARDEERNSAKVLAAWLSGRSPAPGAPVPPGRGTRLAGRDPGMTRPVDAKDARPDAGR